MLLSFSQKRIRRRVLGGLILFGSVISAIVICWIWLNTTVNYHQRIALYFHDSVHGLSVGSEVRMGGEKIGQVSKMELRDVRVTDGLAKRYAAVEATVDMRKFHHRAQLFAGNHSEEITKYINEGLRAKLMLPSLLSAGLSVELFFDRDSMPVFVDDEDNAYPEIPTDTKTTAKRIDTFNSIFEKYDFKSLDKRIHDFENRVKVVNAMFAQIDFSEVNAELLAALGKVEKLVSPEEFHTAFVGLNAALDSLNEGIESGSPDIDLRLQKLAEQVKFFSERFAALRLAVAEVNASLPSLPQPTDVMLKNSEKIRSALDALMNSFVVPTSEQSSDDGK